MKVYKVVVVVKDVNNKDLMLSCRTFPGHILYSHRPSKSILVYETGKTTVPNFGAIFTFRTIKDAEHFITSACVELGSTYAVLEGSGRKWKEGFSFVNPEGTILVKEFKPAKEVRRMTNGCI